MQVFAAQAAVAINKARMFHNATTDGQTQLGNKKFFMQRLTEEFCRAQRHQKPISLILMDIDFFHKINEGYGDHNGDKVLREAGNIFRQTTRVHDLVARFGPDSFAMLLPETEAAGAKIVAQKLKDALSQTVIRVDNKSIQVTASFGIGASTRSTEKASDLLKYAEKAIKQAQRKGGNQIA
jgi:diguanylate cyclase (GGDEF)-like protein